MTHQLTFGDRVRLRGWGVRVEESISTDRPSPAKAFELVQGEMMRQLRLDLNATRFALRRARLLMLVFFVGFCTFALFSAWLLKSS